MFICFTKNHIKHVLENEKLEDSTWSVTPVSRRLRGAGRSLAHRSSGLRRLLSPGAAGRSRASGTWMLRSLTPGAALGPHLGVRRTPDAECECQPDRRAWP